MRATTRRLVAAVLTAAVLLGSCSSDDGSSEPTDVTSSGRAADPVECGPESETNGPEGDGVVDLVEQVAEQNGLTSLLYRVERGDEVVASGAYGENLTGVPADTSLHFRIGNVAFGYMGTLLLLFDESGEADLDDPVSRWLPDWDLPSADEVTLRMLVQNTSGYPDYVPDDAFVDAFLDDPFREFDPRELVHIGLSSPSWYPPGTAWSYAHTNYVILGAALEAIGDADLATLLTSRVIEPLELADTSPVLTPALPEPALHSYSTERDVLEETTSWNPSWQTAPGSVVASTICDMATTAAGVGSGRLLSPMSYEELLTPAPGSLQPPPESCPVCVQLSESTFFGLGVLSSNGWVFQAPLFGGTGGVAAHLPEEDLTVALLAVAGPGTTPNDNVAMAVWAALAAELSPDHLPRPPGR